VIDVAFRRYNLALGAGLSKVAGKVFRIGHLGDLNELMLMGALAGAEMAMLDVGIKVTPERCRRRVQLLAHPRSDSEKESQPGRAVLRAHSTGSIQGNPSRRPGAV